ncbi:hypothetical protein J4573_25760 [Actinomadura barringtoniae]|uniref:DUF3558 domain-containing protein n=1 Tax=Actinomadura barringtoniae TaxID=1427535 RepID=A0A939TBT8_9ACTN|nr:hypothetical protein [Actinomadura barringtoniae]MBO2450535.1 hypothetical protein [Actinomadura barringtoniae]
MRRRTKVYIALGMAVIGALLGGGVVWSGFSQADDDDEPVPVVRSACDLVDQARLDQVLPHATVESESLGLTEPGAEGESRSDCTFEMGNDYQYRLSLTVVRHGETTGYKRQGKNRGPKVTHPAVENARKAYDLDVKSPEYGCTLTTVIVPGVAACAGNYLRDPAYVVKALHDKTVVTVIAVRPTTGREPQLQRLAQALAAAA